jgi:hypothetical protein
VVARVHHYALGAHAGAGHHRRRYPYPYVPTVGFVTNKLILFFMLSIFMILLSSIVKI